MSKIAFFELEGWEAPIIQQALAGHELLLSKDKVAKIPTARDVEIVSVFVNSRVDRAVLDGFPKLQCLTTRSTGYDHLDVGAARERGVTVQYVPGYGDNTVAEFTLGLMLCLTRKIYPAVHQIKETGSFSLAGLRGVDLKGKVLGIVGMGRIGVEVARLAKSFGMQLIGYDPKPNGVLAQELGLTYYDLDRLLASSDIVTLHCPYLPATHHLINRANLAKVKHGAYLVNTARGPIVETAALVEALQSGQLAGAALDVLEEEGETKDELNLLASGQAKAEGLTTMLRNHLLMRMPNVLVTPHNAFNSQEALERILHITLENIQSFLAGKPMNVVP